MYSPIIYILIKQQIATVASATLLMNIGFCKVCLKAASQQEMKHQTTLLPPGDGQHVKC